VLQYTGKQTRSAAAWGDHVVTSLSPVHSRRLISSSNHQVDW